MKWLVGPSSMRNRATSVFMSFDDTGRCYGVFLCRADASDNGSLTAALWRQSRDEGKVAVGQAN